LRPVDLHCQGTNTGAGSASSGRGKSANDAARRSVVCRLPITETLQAGGSGSFSTSAVASTYSGSTSFAAGRFVLFVPLDAVRLALRFVLALLLLRIRRSPLSSFRGAATQPSVRRLRKLACVGEPGIHTHRPWVIDSGPRHSASAGMTVHIQRIFMKSAGWEWRPRDRACTAPAVQIAPARSLPAPRYGPPA
jgi:hypothetical protein